MFSNEAALKAVHKEWMTLHENVWDFRKVRSKKDVMNEARREGNVVQFGRVHALCHEKMRNCPWGIQTANSRGEWFFLETT
jgi:hypothetical protein